MPQTTLSIRIDEDLKKQLDSICEDFGMSITTAITVFAKTIVRERRIPFEISANEDPFYSSANQKRLRASLAQYEARQGFATKTIAELQAMEHEE